MVFHIYMSGQTSGQSDLIAEAIFVHSEHRHDHREDQKKNR